MDMDSSSDQLAWAPVPSPDDEIVTEMRACEPCNRGEEFASAPISQGSMREVLESNHPTCSQQLEFTPRPAPVDDHVKATNSILDTNDDSSTGSLTSSRRKELEGTGSRSVHTPESLQILRTWWEKNELIPYPSQREVYEMSRRTNLTLQQISDWFKNERSRKWRDDPRKKKANRLPPRATRLLSTWASEHLSHPNPSREQREDLAKESGVTYVQVSNWFMNFRKRSKARIRKAKASNIP
ncbi:protein MpBELL2 [Marchantia polymorpha subsp. ruderalis]|uniref:Homeobox domain-containing protein n=2 Tax=Marchantia polymorpha TaxID=3197 RepID=A0AAF6B864_MARPO|nr:hypothetical protein MARPO_0132s0008 [Marchantia polymorpha]BBN08198.1 hypothetical protein Mp_4g09650 [Marchantia polymorpha subsp. ruderalis]|eukprot:PTQ29928.1 hypothetical protein MARPO_0132s0008 [Marchantia polymorpha]